MKKIKTHNPIIAITNFKCFNKTIRFEFKPITILVGPNGSGKSTVIEALDIFSKSLKVFATGEISRDFLNNYSFDNLISDKSKRRFELSINSQFVSEEIKTEEIKVTLTYKNEDGNPTFCLLRFERVKKIIDSNINGSEKFCLKLNLGAHTDYLIKALKFENIIESIKEELPTDFLEEIVSKKKEIEKIISFGMIVVYPANCSFSERRSDEEKLIMNISYGILANNFFSSEYVEDRNILILLVYLVYKQKDGGDVLSFDKFSKLCEDSVEDFKAIRSSFDDVETSIGADYLFPDTRRPPPNFITATNNVIENDWYGLSSFLLGMESPIRFQLENGKSALEYWLSEFEIADKISIRQVEKLKPNTKTYEITLTKKGKSFPLSSLSSGGKQLIPIVLGCYAVWSLLSLAMYVKQPELHLHPKLQMKLADFFMSIKKEVETWFLMIETHSEHLIRKFQLLIAKGEIRPDELNVVYFNINEKDNSTDLVELPLNDRGMFTKPWPHGFFEESAALNIQLIEEILSRKN